MASTLWPTNGTFTGRQIRQTIGAAWGALTGRPLGARSGVVAGTPSTVVSISGSTYSVLAHKGVLDVESSLIAGPYNYSFDSTQTGTVNAADATFDRADLLSITMSDTSEGDASISGPTITYTPGTPAATPTQPATPAKSIPFARISVPKLGTGSATITLIAPFAVAAGGIVPELSVACTDVGGFTTARLEITSAGAMSVFVAAGQTAVSWVSLDGLQFAPSLPS
jgi:hypothetical protein